jgi:hypothetical protein
MAAFYPILATTRYWLRGSTPMFVVETIPLTRWSKFS